MLLKADKNKARQKRHLRVRNHIAGTAELPRLNVYRSLANQDKGFENYGGNIEAAKAVGAEIAKRALEKGITEVVFDRGGYVYHGRVAALAEAAREAGLKF